jgi:antitoxin ParD1/3/4
MPTRSQRRLKDAERLAAIRARIRRSIDDPRRSLTEEEADTHFKALFAETAKVRSPPVRRS